MYSMKIIMSHMRFISVSIRLVTIRLCFIIMFANQRKFKVQKKSNERRALHWRKTKSSNGFIVYIAGG